MKRILFILLIVSSLQPLLAQGTKTAAPAQKSGFDKSRITVGGALGASFGNGYSVVQIAPQVGYNFTNYFNAGVGLQYVYYGFKNYDANYFGFNVYGRVTIANYFIAMVQPEINRVWWSNKNYGTNGTALVPALIVGAGVRLQNIYMMLQYDIVQNEYSPYGRSIFYSVGFAF
ncbi:MAG: hypothetical protein FWF72_02530 [Paludibacter sp.]|nr:hypothetical protein [Paludibacter sp.]